MSETKAPEAVVSQQPGSQAPPTLSKLQQVTGTEEWHDDIFNCLEGPDNLCEYSRLCIMALLMNNAGLKATFCSCFVYGKLAHRMRDPTLSGYERINTDVRTIFFLII